MNNLEKETMEMAKRAARKFVYDEINWEQRRYEIAKEVLGKLVIWKEDVDEINYERSVRDALQLADELIKQLKGGKPCE